MAKEEGVTNYKSKVLQRLGRLDEEIDAMREQMRLDLDHLAYLIHERHMWEASKFNVNTVFTKDMPAPVSWLVEDPIISSPSA